VRRNDAAQSFPCPAPKKLPAKDDTPAIEYFEHRSLPEHKKSFIIFLRTILTVIS